jgi:hypothetical protein
MPDAIFKFSPVSNLYAIFDFVFNCIQAAETDTVKESCFLLADVVKYDGDDDCC